MPISFSCEQCGKAYAVSDGLAGKKAQCKQCGNRMVVPGGMAGAGSNGSAASRPLVTSPRPVSPVAVSKPKPIPTTVPDDNDLYGFNDAPSSLPPLMPRSGGSGGSEEAESPVKKKKKKKGFFGGGPPKKQGGSGETSPLVKGIGGLFLVLTILGAIRTFGISSKSDIVQLTERQLSGMNRLTTALSGVRDATSAQVASGQCNAILDEMYNDLNVNGRKSARIEDVKAVERELAPRLTAAGDRFTREVQRVMMIPGVANALNIQASAQRYANLAAELAATNQKAGLN